MINTGWRTHYSCFAPEEVVYYSCTFKTIEVDLVTIERRVEADMHPQGENEDSDHYHGYLQRHFMCEGTMEHVKGYLADKAQQMLEGKPVVL